MIFETKKKYEWVNSNKVNIIDRGNLAIASYVLGKENIVKKSSEKYIWPIADRATDSRYLTRKLWVKNTNV